MIECVRACVSACVRASKCAWRGVGFGLGVWVCGVGCGGVRMWLGGWVVGLVGGCGFFVLVNE